MTAINHPSFSFVMTNFAIIGYPPFHICVTKECPSRVLYTLDLLAPSRDVLDPSDLRNLNLAFCST